MEGHHTSYTIHGGRKNISPFAAAGPTLLSPFAALAPTFLLGQQPQLQQQLPQAAAGVQLATTQLQQQQQQQHQQAGVNSHGQLLQQQQNVMLHAQEDLMRVRGCCKRIEGWGDYEGTKGWLCCPGEGCGCGCVWVGGGG